MPAYVVLGLIARHGPMTPHELSARVERGISFSWPVPYAVLDRETSRLAELGLLTGETAQDGEAGARAFRLTPAGERALHAWLAAPDVPPADDRDPARVRLAFAGLGETGDLVRLARGQAARHEELFGDYRGRRAALQPGDPAGESRARVLELAMIHERAHAAFWRTLAAAGDEDEPGAGESDEADAVPGETIQVPHYS